MFHDTIAPLRGPEEDLRAGIKARWEALLRIEQTTTPLGSPDVLIGMFDQTLTEVFALLAKPNDKAVAPPAEVCVCNPYRHYYRSAEQALLEALVLHQSRQPALSPEQRDRERVALQTAVRMIAARDIGLFRDICQHRHSTAV